jgi:hypothetical protein
VQRLIKLHFQRAKMLTHHAPDLLKRRTGLTKA